MEFYCQKKSASFSWVCRLRENQTSKWETSLRIKSDRKRRAYNLCGQQRAASAEYSTRAHMCMILKYEPWAVTKHFKGNNVGEINWPERLSNLFHVTFLTA